MKKYRLNHFNVDKVIFQNKADVLDCIEGCLLDDLLLITKRGYMALLETYATQNSSVYTMVFSKNPKEINEIWEKRERNE